MFYEGFRKMISGKSWEKNGLIKLCSLSLSGRNFFYILYQWLDIIFRPKCTELKRETVFDKTPKLYGVIKFPFLVDKKLTCGPDEFLTGWWAMSQSESVVPPAELSRVISLAYKWKPVWCLVCGNSKRRVIYWTTQPSPAALRLAFSSSRLLFSSLRHAL